ncbi:Rossmann fold domain-containing protein [Sphingomonas sp.]|uniref:Rossmann fold domain-containing protein n=1 Tax=Sphingomonas sp. TaxID=28214 RepID=UPI0035BC8C65
MRVARGDDVAVIVRAAAGEALTLILDGGESVEHAVLLAAIAPLAIERAPMRVNAVVAGVGADPADIEAAVAFLDSARSTTGQLLRVA